MGIGEEIAKSLAEAGANLILFSRSEVGKLVHVRVHYRVADSCLQDKLVKLKEKILATSSINIAYRAVDVGNYADVDAAVASSIEEIGHVDILINNVSNSQYKKKSLRIDSN